MHDVMGAILAGGRSVRMGRDKATLPLRDGRTMLEHVADALCAACGKPEIAIVGVRAMCASDAVPTPGRISVPDLRTFAGPLAGIEALLASNLAREYLVCPCDVPHITADVLRLLLQPRSERATVLRIAACGECEPLPARISAAALSVARGLLDDGERSVWRLMEALPAAVVEIDNHRAAALRNINAPEDLNMP